MSKYTIRAQRIDARWRGDRTFIGTPCPHGHTERWASSGNCIECHKSYTAEERRIRRFALDLEREAKRLEAERHS